MDAMDVKSKCSIRGRVAFVLAISQQCLGLLKYSEKIYNFTAKGLEDAWTWEEGGSISGDQLDYYLENPEEESLAVYGCDPPKSAWAAVMAITSALSYVIWHAYKKDGVMRMSETIHEVSESVFDEVIDFAKQSPAINDVFLDRLSKYIVENYSSADSSDLGKSIPKASVLQACRAVV